MEYPDRYTKLVIMIIIMIKLSILKISLINDNIIHFRPSVKKPIALIVIDGSITSSIKYNNLKDGNAIVININAGVIVHIISKTVPCVKYL